MNKTAGFTGVWRKTNKSVPFVCFNKSVPFVCFGWPDGASWEPFGGGSVGSFAHAARHWHGMGVGRRWSPVDGAGFWWFESAISLTPLIGDFLLFEFLKNLNGRFGIFVIKCGTNGFIYISTPVQ